jgi:adenine-specific DNA-methyltransferase
MEKELNFKELLEKIKTLEDEIKSLKNRKKYGLVWEDKPEQVVLDCQNKLPILKEVKNKEIKTDKDKPVNILIEGDNYHSLSVLNYAYKEKIDVIIY